MSLPFFLLLAIFICAIGLAYLLYPQEKTRTPRRVVRKRKAAGGTGTTPPPKTPSPDEIMMAKAGMTEKEAIRKVVEAFVDEDPVASAKILRNWMKER